MIIGEDTFHIEEEKEIQSTEDPYRQRDGFWIYPNEKLAEEIYYNPDSVNGGQIVRNYITFSQIRNADVFAKGDPERFFLYLDTVCRQELQDLDPGGEDVEAALDALFGEPDLCGTTKETMDALYASAKASVTKEKAAPKMSGPER